MSDRVEVYLEVGKRRVFAGALQWLGWCRSGRDEDEALAALLAYGSRYAAAMGPSVSGFAPASDGSAFDVIERLEGDATTDFGAPSIAPAWDREPIDERELERLTRQVVASWAAFDRTVDGARDAVLRKGPRGGGRDLEAIAAHVLEADRAYLGRLAGTYHKPTDTEPAAAVAGVRAAVVQALAARARDEPLPEGRRSTKAPWTPRYGGRRVAWHVLDHAWEIEDRAEA